MKIKVRDMILISLFTALTAVGGFLKIPTPIVPFTLQTLFCAYAGVFLGSKKGMYSQLIYVLIGLAGVPIFTKGGGLAYIFEPTFGFLLGFILCAYVIGKVIEKNPKVNFMRFFAAAILGLAFTYIIGIPYMYLMINRVAEVPITFSTAIKIGFIPFIAQDLIKCVIVAVTSVKIVPILKRAGYIE